jgi:hypothetical protein
MAAEFKVRKSRAPAAGRKAPHSTADSRHEEAEQVYRRLADLEIETSKQAVRKPKNKT